MSETTSDTDDLRRIVDEQQEQIEQQAKELEALRATLEGGEWDGSVSSSTRRQVMQGAGALGLGTLLGGGAMTAADTAAADASTTDSDGDIGTPSNRVDAFLDGADAQSVTTESLVDSGDGQAWETLREVGYEKGDILTKHSFTHRSGTSLSVSMSTYQTEFSAVNAFALPLPSGVGSTIQVRHIPRLDPGTDETHFVRLKNLTDGEAIAGTEVSATTAGFEDSGWQSYTPPTADTGIQIITEQKTDPGNNSSALNTSTAYIGIKL